MVRMTFYTERIPITRSDDNPWHDWAMVSYKDGTDSGYTNVPAKLLCFLRMKQPDGSFEIMVICHPCQWRSKSVSLLINEWCLVACDAESPQWHTI